MEKKIITYKNRFWMILLSKIDESEIIGNWNIIYWMFSLIDIETKEASVFWILNNRTSANLLHVENNNDLNDGIENVNEASLNL